MTSADGNEVVEHVEFVFPPAGAFSDWHPCGGGEGVFPLVPLWLTRHNILVNSLIVWKSVFALLWIKEHMTSYERFNYEMKKKTQLEILKSRFLLRKTLNSSHTNFNKISPLTL